jgi:cation diffusion facilitator CzcD-associated flavoprotein CzcO
VIEEAGDVGGTWYWNRYPGARCDIQTIDYSYTFDPELDREWTWSEKYATQPEILRYFGFVADRYDLRRDIRFGTRVKAANWDDASERWLLTTDNGASVSCRYYIMATGCLSTPKPPEIDGVKDFKGAVYFTGRWPHDGVNLAGKRVAVIGNGASALQFIPKIAPAVGKLTIFQRSNNWVVPRGDRPYSEREKRWFRRSNALRLLHRGLIYFLLENNFFAFRPGTLWAKVMEKRARALLAEQVPDPAMREKLTPDYPIGCKRILIGDDYYPALVRENVEVVTEPIARVTEDCVVTADGRAHPVDAIIYATGFVTTSFLAPMHITGRGGVRIEDAWKEGAEAYLGVAVAGFPNFFMLYGPNTNLGHNSIIFMIECQVRYVMSVIDAMKELRARWLDVRPEAMARFNEELRSQLDKSVWATGCTSWYKTEGGKITNNWSDFTVRYWWRTRRPQLAAFEHGRPAV